MSEQTMQATPSWRSQQQAGKAKAPGDMRIEMLDSSAGPPRCPSGQGHPGFE